MAWTPTGCVRAWRRARRRVRQEGGFTLIEVMAAVLLLTIGVIGSFQLFDGANAATNRTRAREGATNLAREIVEAARSVPYGDILSGSINAQLQTTPGLEDTGGGGGWQIGRRGVTYSIATSVCIVDDAKDGLGAHTDSSFCGAVGGTTDKNPDDYRRVTVDVSWSRPGGGGNVRESTVISNGDGGGPAITSFTMTSAPNQSPITSQVSPVQFGITTDTPAETVSWSVDGVYKGTATGSLKSWSFSWPVSTLYDGTYLVSAQAFDRFGSPGPSKVYTVLLNRNAPLAPAGFSGGWNGSIVEFEWLSNVEGDIEGYRVYRRSSTGPDVLVCGLSSNTACVDSSPPNQPSTDYYVVAVDRDPSTGALREGPGTIKTVVQGNNPPNPPTGLTAVKDQAGNTVLSWTAPQPADPDPGDSIAFYRIYRDGNRVADRYDRTGTGQVTYTDNKTGGSTHTYWVSAVDGGFAESPLVGPVTK